MAPLTYDGTTSLKDFLHELYDRCYPQTPSAWIKAVYCRLEGEALEWAKNDEDVVKIHYNAYHNVANDRDGRTMYQLLDERFSTSLHSRVDEALKAIKQEPHESIEDYYTRVNTLFEHVGGQDRPIDVDKCLDHEHGSCLLKAVDYFVDGLRNTKLRRSIAKTLQEVSNEGNAAAVSLESTCNAAQWTYTTIKQARRVRKQLFGTDTSIVIDMSQSSLEEIPCDLPETSTSIYPPTSFFAKPIASESTSPQKPLFETSTGNESPAVSLQKPSQMQEKCSVSSPRTSTPPPAHTSKPWLTQNWRARPLLETCIDDQSPPVPKNVTCSSSESCNEDITNTPGKPVASKSTNWPISTSLQKSSPKASIAYESPPVLEQIRSEISEIDATTMDSSDTESTDEILASGPRKWIVVAAEKKIFDSISILAVISKSPSASHIEKNIETVKISNNSFDQNIVDVKISKKKIFEFIMLFDEESKNSLASYFEYIEISIIVNMSSQKHFINENDFVIEIFDFDIELNSFSKNSLIQHIENSKTMKKNSIHIYEFFAFSIFDFNIDIDFNFYSIDIENIETIEFHTMKQISCENIYELFVFFVFDFNIDIDFETTNIETNSFD